MAGSGEAWSYLLKKELSIASITAVDFSPRMNELAHDRLRCCNLKKVKVVEADVLNGEIPTSSADFIILTFGLKTMNHSQQAQLAREVAKILRPGGVFSMIEASDPSGWHLRWLYRAYLAVALPLIEWLFLKGAHDFSMIGPYTRGFADCRYFAHRHGNKLP